MPVTEDKFLYKNLTRLSGPQAASGEDYDMNTNSAATDTVFGYIVPVGKSLHWARINMNMVDGSINPGDFGGIAGGLTDGCLLGVYDPNGVQKLDFLDNVPLRRNFEFALLAGTDVPISELAGDDMLPIRFTIARAGDTMIIPAGWSIRWTNRDDLSGLTHFRMMVQGLLK